MKRILLSLALVLACISASGQETDAWSRFEVNWGYGLVPLIQAEKFNEGSAWRIGAGSLGSIYRPYTSEVRMTGAFCAEFGYRTSRKWTISLMTSFNQVFGARSIQAFHSGDDYQVNFRTESVNGYNIAIIPRWRYDYIIKPGFRMYSSFGMGFGLYVNYHTGEDSYYEPVQGEIQLVPLGITFGRKWFGLVETGFGSQYVGGRIGFGYRF